MNLTAAAILFHVGLFFAIVAVVLDWQSSKNFIYYGLTEFNRWTTDKFGFFNVRKNLIISFAMLALVAVAGCLGYAAEKESEKTFAFLVAGVFSLLPTGLRGWAYFDNKAAAKRGRDKQIKLLRELRACAESGGTEDDIAMLFNPHKINRRGGRTYYFLFGWMYSENPDYYAALAEIQSRLAALSLTDEARWFPQ